MKRKSKKQIVRERRLLLACAGVFTVWTVYGFATVNRAAKDFEAAYEAHKAEPMAATVVVQPAATPAPVLYDVPLFADLQLFIIAECERKGVDPAIVIAMIERESCYTPGAIGDNGNSYGLMQIQPRWHADRMARLGVTDLLDPVSNVRVGIDFLAELLERYDGDYGKALTAYNQGQYKGTVTSYANAVLDIAEELRGESV